jgi:hypothetical protein
MSGNNLGWFDDYGSLECSFQSVSTIMPRVANHQIMIVRFRIRQDASEVRGRTTEWYANLTPLDEKNGPYSMGIDRGTAM